MTHYGECYEIQQKNLRKQNKRVRKKKNPLEKKSLQEKIEEARKITGDINSSREEKRKAEKELRRLLKQQKSRQKPVPDNAEHVQERLEAAGHPDNESDPEERAGEEGIASSSEGTVSDDVSAQADTHHIQQKSRSTKLLFFRKYATCQALYEIYASDGVDGRVLFNRVVLYIMQWFVSRVGEENIAASEEFAFLKDCPKSDEGAEKFDINVIKNFHLSSLTDAEALWQEKQKIWSMRLEEPDNGNDAVDIQGRYFITDLSVKMGGKSTFLAVRIVCREPSQNNVDATPYRPAFMRSMQNDGCLIITEAGLDKKYAFEKKPILLNGKAKTECQKIYSKMENARRRLQMPLLFVSSDVYEKDTDRCNGLAASLLGYAHFVVIKNGTRKLFAEDCIDSPEMAEEIEKGNFVLWRGSASQQPFEIFDYENEDYEEGIYHFLRERVQRESMRKAYRFEPCIFLEPLKEDALKSAAFDGSSGEDSYNDIVIDRLNEELAAIRMDVESLQIERDGLRKMLNSTRKGLTRAWRDEKKRADNLLADNEKISEELASLKGLDAEAAEKAELDQENVYSEEQLYGPVMRIPVSANNDQILGWIKSEYEDTIILHPKAEDSFKKSASNFDRRRFCMMIHYLNGYTLDRRNGRCSTPEDPDAGRSYDVAGNGFKVTFCTNSSNSSTIKMHGSSYKLKIKNYNPDKNEVLMDLHIKNGVTSNEMIRIYFYYDSDLGKSIIGYMPDHLPTRDDPH